MSFSTFVFRSVPKRLGGIMIVVHAAMRTVCSAGGIAAILVIAVASSVEAEVTFIESFENGSNTGAWYYGNWNGAIVAAGGNPDAYFGVTRYATPFPLPLTTQAQESVFTGNYRSKQVTSVGLDTSIFHVNLHLTEDRPLSVVLRSWNGTPTDYSDDWAAFFVGPTNVPAEGAGWASYDLDIPSQATSLPTGWDFIQIGPNTSPTSFDWNNLITDVGSLGFSYGNPELIALYQDWDMGIDNMRITMVPEPGGLILLLSAGFMMSLGRWLLGRKGRC